MTTSATARRLTSALRARFPGGPKDFLRRIGLDENLLDVGALGGGSGKSGKSGDAARELRVEIEQILPELHLEEDQLGPLMRILEEHCPLGSASDDEEKIGEYLRGRGLGEPDVKTALDMVRRRAIGRDESEEERGRLTERERSQIGRPGSEAREEMPAAAFLEPNAKKYPVKAKRDGEWKFDRALLLAAARESRMHGNEALAKRADAIREREFGGATDVLPKNALRGGFGGKFSEKRAQSPMTMEQIMQFRKLLADRGIDDPDEIIAATSGALSPGSMAGDARTISEIRLAMSRISTLPNYSPERRPAQRAPTSAQRASFLTRYGDAARLG